MSNKKDNPAGYSGTAKSEAKSITILDFLLNEEKVISYLSKNDKTPNYDGYLESIDLNGYPIGKLEVQVKTLQKSNYDSPKYPIKSELLWYIKNVSDLPFLFIVVNQLDKKAFWKYISKGEAYEYLSILGEQDSINLDFDSSNEIRDFPPYEDWESLIKNARNGVFDEERAKTIELKINNSSPIIDQLDEFIEEIDASCKFIPPHLLANSKPIFLKEGQSYYNNFHLSCDNDQLISLLESVDTDEENNFLFTDDKLIKGVNNPNEKLKRIIKYFVRHLVHTISSKKNRRGIEISKLNQEEKCDCSLCLLEGENYSLLGKRLKKKRSDLDELLSKSYLDYKLGNYIFASQHLIKAKKLAAKNGDHFQKFLIQFNLSKLQLLLNGISYRIEVPKAIQNDFEKIDMDIEFCNSSEKTLFPLIDWMYRERFVYSAEKGIRDLVSKIKERQQSSLNGGWSNNQFVSSLINKFAQLELFLDKNFIVYDQFGGYKKIAEMFVEGLYASHAISGKQSRLLFFDDWILKTIIKNITPDFLIILLNRYKLSFININDEKGTIGNFIIELISNSLEGRPDSEINFETGNEYFLSNRQNRIRTAIILAGQCKFDINTDREIAKTINKYIRKNGSHFDQKSIEYFIRKKGANLTSSGIKQFIFSGIKKDHFHSESFYESIEDTFDLKKHKVGYTDKQFSDLKKFCINDCSICNQKHRPTYFTIFYKIGNDKQKKAIQSFVMESLELKFNSDLFAFSVSLGIIQLKGKWLDLFIISSKPKIITTGSVQTFFRGEPNERYRDLNLLLNICFKENVDLSDPKFNDLKGINDYYDWLLDMDNFDYSLFEPKWICENATRFFYKRMNNCHPLMIKLEQYFKSKESYNSQEVMNSYINIYVRKTWDK